MKNFNGLVKKGVIIWLTAVCLLSLLAYPQLLFAQSAAKDSPTPTQTAENTLGQTPTPPSKSKVEEIKEKVANTVAQLNLVTKRGIVGQIIRLEKNQITIDTGSENRLIDVDELTKYYQVSKNDSRDSIKFVNLNIGNSILAIGLYNKETRKLLGRIIVLKTIPSRIIGMVREVDIKGGTISVEDKKTGKTYLVDIERTTKINNYTKATGVEKWGISKIEIGQKAFVYGLPDEKEENRVSGLRILLLPQKVSITPSEAKGEASSSGSGQTRLPTQGSTSPAAKPNKVASPTGITP